MFECVFLHTFQESQWSFFWLEGGLTGGNFSVFRWFKFTLKPPYSIVCDKYNWPFGTLPFGLFGSNLDTKDLETYPRTYSGHFSNMSLFGDSRAI